MFKWLKTTALWVVAIPVLCLALGTVSNQAVLLANHDKFPVKMNDYTLASTAMAMEEAAQSPDPQTAMQAQFDLEAFEKEGFLDKHHVVMTPHTHLNLLADWIDVKTAAYSPGDGLIYVGEHGFSPALLIWATLVVSALWRKREEE